MGFYENGLERAAAICVGTASMAFGGLGPAGALEASIGAAGLAGFVLGSSQKFGPECSRVRGRIQKRLLTNYRDFIRAEGDDWALSADLEAANDALEQTLEACVIDRKRLAETAVTPQGFPDGAVAIILDDLGKRRPDLFAPDKSDTLGFIYARDVIRAGIEAAVEDVDYYRQLEPLLMLEMASKLGIIHAAIDAVRDDIRGLQSTIEELVKKGENRAREFGIKEGLLIALARNYAEGSPDDFETALTGLQRALDVAHAEAERDRLPSNIDGALDAVLKRIDMLNNDGEIDAAQEAIEGELAAMDEEDTRRKAARYRLLEKGLAQAFFTRSVESAVRFVLEIGKLDADTPEAAWALYNVAQNDFWERGRDKGLKFDLEVAIGLSRATLKEWTRNRVPLEWAATQNNLANALLTLGKRESGTAHVVEATTVYRAILESLKRDEFPREWAINQDGLGAALQTLGKRESGTARLVEAITAHNAALEERTPERDPLEWAATQNNLGSALHALGERESGTARLEEAVVAYRAALEERTPEGDPLGWATTQSNLGSALSTLGRQESDTKRLQEAIQASRAALEGLTREGVPLIWATTQNNLGSALHALGERESGTARLEEAVVAYRAALEERTPEQDPLGWAVTQNYLGNALHALGLRENDAARFEEAVVAYRAALEEWTHERDPLGWAVAHNNLGEVNLAFMMKLRQLGDEPSVERYRKSGLEHIDNALSEFDAETTSAYHAEATAVREKLLSF